MKSESLRLLFIGNGFLHGSSHGQVRWLYYFFLLAILRAVDTWVIFGSRFGFSFFFFGPRGCFLNLDIRWVQGSMDFQFHKGVREVGSPRLNAVYPGGEQIGLDPFGSARGCAIGGSAKEV